jgi:hypothetical protein
MPNLINNPGNLTDVAANYRKAFAPFTLFGTRQLRFYFIYINGLNVNHPDNGGDSFAANPYEGEFGGPNGWNGPQNQPNYGVDSAFARAIAGIQTQAEIYGVFHPDSDSMGPSGDPTDDSFFTVMVAGDTHAERTDTTGTYGSNSKTMQDAIYDALSGDNISGLSVNVHQAYIAGDYMDYYYGTSLNKPALSPAEQTAVDALKAAQAAVRALRKGA